MAENATNATEGGFVGIINAGAGAGQNTEGIAIKAFVLNLAVGLGLFAFEVSGFFLLKNSALGRRIYQPKTYLVQDRLRVEAIPRGLLKWIRRILTIKDEELKAKCGLDGYFFIRLIRAMIIIFVPLMVIIVTVLLPINYHGGKGNNAIQVGGNTQTFNVTGLDTLSWQNVSPEKTRRYWGHLVCAILAIVWTLYRIYREKVNFIDVRQRFLTSPEHRLKASARTVLITNIPSEYRSKEALEALFDVFVDNDDRSRLTVWVNRNYKPLRALVARRRKLRHALEKAELKLLRQVTKKHQNNDQVLPESQDGVISQDESCAADGACKAEGDRSTMDTISTIFDEDCLNKGQLWLKDKTGNWKPSSWFKPWVSGEVKKVPKIAWMRAEIARLTVEIEDCLQDLDNEKRYPKENSAFIQFDRQMAAHMACSLVSHEKAGRMSPRYLEVAPHEIIWPNMGVTSSGRLVRRLIALLLLATMLFLWGLPTTFLGFLSQLGSLRSTTTWLHWLRPWPSWVISLISGPGTSILLALLIQLIVPALMRKLAVLWGSPTRSKREVITQSFFFTFLFVELVLVTSISSGIVTIIPTIVSNPVNIPSILATNLPKAANYFFNYLIIQALGFSGSVLFQYLRILYITTIWPWFTQTPREEAWLQTTIPHQMWANVYGLNTNFAAIGLIYSVISPLMLIFVSITFTLFWVAYRHNYYYVQRNKIDTHGLLFNNAISQLFAGIYVLEIALIGLFFLVRDGENNVACSSQAIIMIVVLILTFGFHLVMEEHLQPLYEFLPVTLEDRAANAEQQFSLLHGSGESSPVRSENLSSPFTINSPVVHKEAAPDVYTAANARSTLSRLKMKTTAKVSKVQAHLPESMVKSRRRQVADQLGAAIGSYPDELTDLNPRERQAELKAAFQDPVTREPAPVIWIPQDEAGCSDDAVRQVKGYGNLLQYSNAGAYLTRNGKVQIVQPAPDVRPDWLMDWVL